MSFLLPIYLAASFISCLTVEALSVIILVISVGNVSLDVVFDTVIRSPDDNVSGAVSAIELTVTPLVSIGFVVVEIGMVVSFLALVVIGSEVTVIGREVEGVGLAFEEILEVRIVVLDRAVLADSVWAVVAVMEGAELLTSFLVVNVLLVCTCFIELA